MAALDGENVFLKGAFIPSSISGLVLWLKGDAITGLNDGDAVTTWTDLSLTGDASQSTADNKPTYKVNIVGGKPVVRFDGSNDFMTVASLAVNQPFTWFLVIVPGDLTGLYKYLFLSNSEAGTLFRNDTYNVALYSGATLSTWVSLGTSAQILTGVFNGASSNLYQNGVAVLSGNAGTTNASGAWHIGQWRLGGYNPAMDLGEVLIYTSLSDANRIKVEDYLSARWGIAVTH